MSSVSIWLLSIAGISVLSVVVDVLIPKGQMEKYIKGVFAFVMVLVIIAPIPKILSSEINIGEIFKSEEIVLQQNFLEQTNQNKLTLCKQAVEAEIESRGIDGVKVTAYGNIFDADMKIEKIFVDLSKLVINEKTEHIDIKKTVTDIVLNMTNLKKEQIEFYE